MTTELAYNDFIEKLGQVYEKREAENIADWIFEHATGLKRWERRIIKNEVLNAAVEKKIGSYLHELLQHKPIQYVLGEAWFYRRRFFVNAHVLIPRPETEELISWVIENLQSVPSREQHDNLQLLDIGTGSGCIAISLKKELQKVEMTAIDVSEQALLVAKRNADILQAQINFSRVNFLEESLWDSLGEYDLIISNPPYIPQSEKQRLNKNVTAFEPALALFVPDSDPFIFYEMIAKFAQSHLKPNGKVFAELHENYSGSVKEIFARYQFKTEIKEDMYGKQRMIKAMQLNY